MFIFCILLTLITYPLVVIGSVAVLLFVVALCEDCSKVSNPFVSPNTVYKLYRKTFAEWKLGLISWYKEESK